jgi:thiol-disulfide isomerase/thioredoxin
MRRRVFALSAAFILALYGTAAADGLSVGDAAPKLEVKEFVKGDPVKSFEKKKIYVVEFWATWCGPCRTTIPHVSDLQKKHKDVVFIGVSVWERDKEQSKVKPFVEEMGDKMSYRVAMDDIVTENPNDGKMAKNWMRAAEQDGIPSAFIINGDGKIAWIGHPMNMDKPLEEIISGKWDLAKASADFKVELTKKVKLRELGAKLQKAQVGKDYKTVVAVVDEVIKDGLVPENPNLGLMKYRALASIGETDKIMEYGNYLTDKFKNQPQMTNDLAWIVIEKPGEKPDPKLMKYALGLAEKADKMVEGKHGGIADTLAKAYFENGDVKKAVETQERAVKLSKGTPAEKEITQRLETYKKAANQ